MMGESTFEDEKFLEINIWKGSILDRKVIDWNVQIS